MDVKEVVKEIKSFASKLDLMDKYSIFEISQILASNIKGVVIYHEHLKKIKVQNKAITKISHAPSLCTDLK